MRSMTRKKVRFPIYYGTTQDILNANYTTNLSLGGLFMETDNIRRVNSTILVNFRLPGDAEVIVCNARVAWTNEPGQLKKFTTHHGMGLQFLDLSPEHFHAIRNFLDNGDLRSIE